MVSDYVTNVADSSCLYCIWLLQDLPFLQGRALVFGGQFASILPPELASQYVAGAVSALQQSVAIPVRVSALQALKK